MSAVDWTPHDYRFMARAIQLAKRGLFTTHPNPRVGCVLVNGGSIVGEGWHRMAGTAHAEPIALEAAGSRAKGATCYINLEPCCHFGRTPPCTEALVGAGVSRVVAAMLDPNPKVKGQGLQALRQAGIDTAHGLLNDQAVQLNIGFCKRFEIKRPYVVCKLGASLDGRTATASGESQWITSAASRADVQRLRAKSSAVMTGIGTVLADNPSLNVREPSLDIHGRQPARIVLDSNLRMPLGSRMLSLPGSTYVVTTGANEAYAEALTEHGVIVVERAGKNGQVDLLATLEYLARIGTNEVLLEAGETLAGAMLQAGLVDELVVYIAPKLIGNAGRGLVRLTGLDKLADSLELEITDVRRVGTDCRLTAKVLKTKSARHGCGDV